MSRLVKLAYGEEDAKKIVEGNKFRNIKKDIPYRLQKQYYDSLPDSDKAMQPKPKPGGPFTIGPAPSPEYRGNHMLNKIYMNGDTYKTVKEINRINHGYTRLGVSDLGTLSPKAREALNKTVLAHEVDEVKNLKKSPQTELGKSRGHHSFATVLAPESNRLVTASDEATKAATEFLAKSRVASGEKQIFDNHLALRDRYGIAHSKLNEGQRMNRSYRKALLKAEREVVISDDPNENSKKLMRTLERERKGRAQRRADRKENGFKKQFHSQDKLEDTSTRKASGMINNMKSKSDGWFGKARKLFS